MFCRKCGSELLQDAQFCSRCGTAVITETSTAEAVSPGGEPEVPAYETLNLKIQAPIPTPVPPVPAVEQTPIPPTPCDLSRKEIHKHQLAIAQQTHGMKWYKFLLYVPLIVSPVLSIIYGLNIMLGLQYGDSVDQVYATFSSMQVLDVLCGFLMFAAAAFTIYTRYRLYGFSESAPTLIWLMYIVTSSVGVLYSLAVYMILASYGVEDGSLIAEIISGLITTAFYSLVNYIYFKKRRRYFIY